jgi:hypothetical protein
MPKTKSQIAAIVATLITIAVNAAANILPINGVSTADVSDSFATFFVPAGYVFAIWGIIYLAVVIFAFGYTLVPKKEREYVEEIIPWYILGSIVNIIWIFSWHYGFFLTTVVAMITLLVSLIAIQQILSANTVQSTTERLIIHLPFNIYLGWVSVAAIANISDVLWYYGFTGFGINGALWAAMMMIVASVLAVLVTKKTQNMAFGAVVIWAVIGIIVRFSSNMYIIGGGAIAIAIIIIGYLFKIFSSKKKVDAKKNN